MKQLLLCSLGVALSLSVLPTQAQTILDARRPQKTQFAAPAARADVEHQWESIGTCSWVDDVLCGLFSGITYYTTSSEAQQDALHENVYKILAPYGSDCQYNSALANYLTDNGDNGYILIDASDADNVIIEPSPLGVVINGEEMTLCSYSWLEKQGVVPTSYIESQGLRGTMVDGTISFPGEGSLWITSPSLDEKETGYRTGENGKFQLTLPWAADYSIELLTASWCADDEGRIIVSAWCGDDVATVKAGFVSDFSEEAIAGMTDVVALTPKQGAYMNIPAGCGNNQRLILAALAYDAAGTQMGVAYNVVYAPDKSTNWTRSDAKASFKEYIVSHVYTDINLGTYEVAVDVDTECPGRYRLVNPYADVSYNTLSTGTHGSHDHYLYIDASDPDCVVLEESPIGVVFSNDGDLRVSSRAARCINDGYTKDEVKALGYGGVMQKGVVKFPFQAYTYIGFLVEGYDYWMNVNFTYSNGTYTDGPMYIDLSAVQASVDSPVADIQQTADETIYDLQGRRVDGKPTPGLYIQGRKKVAVTK